MKIRRIEYPFTAEKTLALRLGEITSLSGRIWTGRDRLHRYLFDGGKCPVELRDGAIYHCGPVVLRSDNAWAVRSAGPTTSFRQERYTAKIIESLGVRVIIGKGGMGEATRMACAKHGCVYLQVVGGAAVLQAQSIKEVTGVHFLDEFGPADALWEFIVADFKAVVTMDARGKSLHKRVRTVSKRILAAQCA